MNLDQGGPKKRLEDLYARQAVFGDQLKKTDESVNARIPFEMSERLGRAPDGTYLKSREFTAQICSCGRHMLYLQDSGGRCVFCVESICNECAKKPCAGCGRLVCRSSKCSGTYDNGIILCKECFYRFRRKVRIKKFLCFIRHDQYDQNYSRNLTLNRKPQK